MKKTGKFTRKERKIYNVCSIAACAAICNIENFIYTFDKYETNLQTLALKTYLEKFFQPKDSLVDSGLKDRYYDLMLIVDNYEEQWTNEIIRKLLTIRNEFLNNADICIEWDEIKCFLRLMSYDGLPLSIQKYKNCLFPDCDCFYVEIIFKEFTITKDESCTRYKEICTNTPGQSYAIDVDYQDLKLLLSGDVETNPGPTHSKELTLEERHRLQINEMKKQISKLKKSQEKQSNFLQRQLELEKRDRKKQREQMADRKVRHAQTLVSETFSKLKDDASALYSSPTALAETVKATTYVAANTVLPGAGTAAAAIVNGSKLSAAVDRLNPTIDMLQGALKNLTSASDEIKDLFKVPKEYDLIGILVSLVAIANHLKERQLFLVSLHCTNLARQLGVTIEGLMNLIPSFSGSDVSFTDDETTERVGQSLVSDMLETAKNSPQLLPFAGFLSFLCGTFTLLCTGIIPSPADMTKHFSNIGRASQGFRALKDMFTWIFDYLSEIYYTTVYGLTTEEYQFMQNFPQLENLYAAVQLIEKFEKPLIDSSAAIANQVLTVNYQLNEYHYQASKMNSRSNVHLVTSLQRRIKEQNEWATHSPARCHTIRTQPVAMYLFGHPGVGKSVATEVLKARIFKKYLKEQGIKYESSAFPRRAKNEYWEGYTGQPIVVLDDFGNVKDSQQKPVEEYEELEYMVNTAQFPLKMAELKSKGVTNFTSEYIIASSNQKYPEIKSLVDPGAVFRRFHVWAEVSIDPAYGIPIGKDEHGCAYYTFDKETVAKCKGIDVNDVPPLTVEHYRFTCYKVSHNKQTGNAEIAYLPDKKNLTFEQFWQYFVEENNRRKCESASLANAIRTEAGIETPEIPATEQQIMDQFDKIFNPEKFIETVAAEETFEVETAEKFVDAEEDSFFGTITHLFNVRERLNKLRDMFEESRLYCQSRLIGLWSRVRECISFTKNKLLSVAQFILSFFSSAAQQVISYLPSVPTSKLLTGICSTALTVFGIWYTGVFRRKPSDYMDSWCQFNRSPTNATVPCGKCKACDIIDYPKTGNMLDHFLDQTGIKSVRNDLLKLGIDRECLEDIREKLRREKPKRRAQRKCPILRYANQDDSNQSYEYLIRMFDSLCLAGCEICDSLELDKIDLKDEVEVIEYAQDLWGRYARDDCIYAQRVYDSQPQVPKPRNYAQRVYEHQPAPVKQRSFAQRRSAQSFFERGYVECKTEMHIGARKYAQRDRVQIEQTTQVLLHNSVWVQAVDKTGACSRSNGVFLVGRTMITTAHTVLNPPHKYPIEYIVIRNPYSVEAAIKVPINQCQISQTFQMDGMPVDLALVSFPPVVPNRPKILSKFIDAKNIDLLKEGDLTFSGFYEIGGKTIVQEKYPSSFTVSTKTTQYYLHKTNECPKNPNACVCPIKIGNHIDYDLETISGMCGALLSISNKLIHTKLIGFHVAGGTGVLALGALTTRQFLEEALQAHVEKFGIPKSYLIDGRLPYSQAWVDTSCQVSLLDVGDCLNIGIAPSPSYPSETQLGPSLVFDKIQKHIAKPAHLRSIKTEEGLVDPMLKGIKKIMGVQTFVDPNLLDAAANDVFQGLGKPQFGKGIVHTYEEAILGVTDDPYKRPINRTTSPGYPYNLNNKSKGKTAWLGDGEDYIVDNPELKQDVENLILDSKQGIRGNAISIATLKDEKRPIAKVDAGKTRVFEACPQHLVIAIRQYYLYFAAHVMRNRIDNGVAVGINPYSLEWTKLAHHLQSKGNQMIAGDFSNFDGSLLMQILVKIMEKINEWYDDDEESQMVRAALWEHICNADILVRGEVIRKTHSQPSGNPLTVIINSLFNGIVMRIAYLILKKEQGLPAICDYRKHVAEIIYGDDDIKSVSVEILDWFNQLTLTKALASFGLTYTDETKTGNILPWKPLEDVAFLKRKFVIQPDGTFLAPMDIESVLEITNWIKGKARISATIENCEQAIMELALHPQAEYEYWSNRIREELANIGHNIVVPTYYEQMEVYRYNRDLYARTEYVPLY
jgi:V8-like Glu-specific endopeptidase